MPETPYPDQNPVLGGAAAATTNTARKDETTHNCLPVGTRLGEFEIIGLIGEGGFGIVYLAQDHSLQRRVALKEYMPASLAARGSDASVVVRSERHQETFNIGRRSFVNEARLLAQFDHPALVKVYRFWEANGTAYMVMPFYEGKTLREVLYESDSAPPEAWIKKILGPIIDALELIHRDNCFHRDIAPDNIILLPGDRPILLDFGAARRVIGDMTQALTVILKPGYAPIEQYAEMPGMKQGPWTDVYALAAVIYFMIARKLPPPSVTRIMQDTYEPLASVTAGGYSDALLKGVDLCLIVRPENRPKNMAEMRQLLGIHGGVPTQLLPTDTRAPRVAQPAVAKGEKKDHQPSSPRKAGSNKWPLLAVLGTFTIVGVAAYYLKGGAGTEQPSTDSSGTTAMIPPQNTVQVEQSTTRPVATLPAFKTFQEALQGLTVRSDATMTPSLQLAANSVAVEGGTLKLSIKTPAAGHAYLYLWDKSEDKLYRIFPNDFDKTTSVSAGSTLAVPRSGLPTPWSFPATEPKGVWEVVAIVSELPRDLSRTTFTPDNGFASSGIPLLNAAFAGGASLEAIIGTIPCEAGKVCADRYGIASATLEEIAPSTVTPNGVEKDRKPLAKQTKSEASAGSKPAAEPSTRKPAQQNKPVEDSDHAEREYMKQLNKDLDKLLGK